MRAGLRAVDVLGKLVQDLPALLLDGSKGRQAPHCRGAMEGYTNADI